MEKKHLKGFLPYFVFAVIMAFSTGAWAQPKTINGTVTDETGSPLPGVTIVVQGTTTGTVTNVDGKYQLEVPATADILVFSYIQTSSFYRFIFGHGMGHSPHRIAVTSRWAVLFSGC